MICYFLNLISFIDTCYRHKDACVLQQIFSYVILYCNALHMLLMSFGQKGN